MRASRLVEIVLQLEARGRTTAPELARQFGVSVRTIFRDMDALAEAGVPIYADRGATGGYRLVDGYRMRPPMLTRQEASALWLAGQPEAARRLGLGDALQSAETKLLAVMGPVERGEAHLVRERLHIEGAGWFGASDEPPFLKMVMEAVWTGRVIRVRYTSWTAEGVYVLDPLGLVLKGGIWYMVARRRDQSEPRTYRISAIREVTLREESVERPSGFDLAAYWRDAEAGFVTRVYSQQAILRLSPKGRREIPHLGTALYLARLTPLAEPDDEGWETVRVPFERVDEAASDLLRLGPEAEVLEPAGLRQAVYRLALQVVQFLDGRRTP